MSSAHPFRVKSDKPFLLAFCALAGFYIVMIVLLVLADVFYTDMLSLRRALASPEIQYAIKLSLISCTIST
ncbi:MAG: hypothetical protein MI757_05370, partial [Pirellulales bacterium]|nr:hypothetical protein [Pirellulales bacterium]